MKKLISLLLAIILVITVGTIGVSAEFASSFITVAPPEMHVRKDNTVYYPILFDLVTDVESYREVCESYGCEDGKTHIVMGFKYDKSSLRFVDVLPSEALYNVGGSIKVTDQGETSDADFDYFVIEIDFSGSEGLDDEYFFNLQFEVLQENFLRSRFPVSLVKSFAPGVSNVWQVTDSNGVVFDLESAVSYIYFSTGKTYDSYDELLITDYEPFIPPVNCDIQKVTYIQQEDTHKDFTVTANGRKQMIQFIEPDGGTRTYDRYNKNVSITSYNADGEAVNELSRDLAYEVWEIHSNMSVGNEIKVRGKENGKWDAEKYSFTIEPYNPVVSMELSSTSGKKGPVSATVIADEKTEKVMFKMPNGTSVTVAPSGKDENGNNIFTGKAWMNEDGVNIINVFIRRDNVWKLVGTLEYTVE